MELKYLKLFFSFKTQDAIHLDILVMNRIPLWAHSGELEGGGKFGNQNFQYYHNFFSTVVGKF